MGVMGPEHGSNDARIETKSAFEDLHRLNITLANININSIINKIFHIKGRHSLIAFGCRDMRGAVKPTTCHLYPTRHFESSITAKGGPNAFHARLFLLAASYEARIMTALPCLLG